jgi:DNA polymerase-3 subunit delta'
MPSVINKAAAASMPVGVDEQGGLPLPWLAAPLAAAGALARSHALLVHGPAGAGQLELSLVIAQAVLCEGRAPEAPLRPCGRCASCHLVSTRVHPDLLLVLPEALRVQLGWVGDDEGRLTKADAKPSRDLKVEQLRDAIAWTQQTSGRGRGKVLLLHPADALNTVSANALLKTLEEPPGGLRIVLTSVDPERLLPTLRSRCQRLPLALPAPDAAAAWLGRQGVADAPVLLAAGGGSPLVALGWAADGLDAAWLNGLPAAVAAGNPVPLTGRPLPLVIDLLLKLAHDALARAAGGQPRFFPQARWPADAELPALVAWQRSLLRAARHDEHPWNAGLLVESLVTQAAQAWTGDLVTTAR